MGKVYGSMRTCTRCGKKRPITDFHRNSTGKDGRLRYCKDCKNNPRRIFKTCIDCKETKQISLFHRHPGAADGHQSLCKSCQSTRQRIRRAKKREMTPISKLMQEWGR